MSRQLNSSILIASIGALVSIASFMLAIQVVDPYKVAVYWLTGIALSLVGVITYYRRLEFLVAGSTHASFLAVTLGYIVASMIGINLYYVAIPVGLLIVYLAGYLISYGMDPDRVSSFIVASTSSLGVIAAYYALTRFPASFSLSSIMLGDPVLMTIQDMVVASIISVAIVLSAFSIYRVVIFISTDPVSARVVGLRIVLYDVATYTIIGLATIGLLRVCGYIMEHVMILVPPILGARISRSSREHLLSTMILSSISSLIGYLIAIEYGLSPVGATGLVLTLIFLYHVFTRRGVIHE